MRICVKPTQELLDALAARSLASVADFQPQVLASSLWALAAMAPLGIALPRAMINTLLSRAQDLAPSFAQQDISNTMWAVASMRVAVPPTVLAALMQRCLDIVDSLSPQGLANITWAIAVLRGSYP